MELGEIAVALSTAFSEEEIALRVIPSGYITTESFSLSVCQLISYLFKQV
jgi:hypothetical protein